MTAKHGGKRPGAGRPAGARNKATRERRATITDLAQDYGEAALATLAEVMRDSDAPHSARVAASNALLDRGYGKPRQEVDHSSSDGSMTPVTGFDIRIANAPASDADEAAG
ncbi:hypothetical protein NM680_12925 [Paracoccus sp. PS-1]|uniref:hypothetical protein n=1 Tax=Paracoccus sp. PS1 TaxID=2963938 RepID=UPI0027E51C27|nr:hypothetical protein [Paracoccus sp. PS1]MDQ7262695.1 hypothetical protein [Paracoccus sp. PS1]